MLVQIVVEVIVDFEVKGWYRIRVKRSGRSSSRRVRGNENRRRIFVDLPVLDKIYMNVKLDLKDVKVMRLT
jgi:hypothetical protein